MSRDPDESNRPIPRAGPAAADSASKKPRPAASDQANPRSGPTPWLRGDREAARLQDAGPTTGRQVRGTGGGPSWWERIMFGRVSSGNSLSFVASSPLI